MAGSSTEQEFDQVAAACRQIFLDKLGDYGPSWVHFRLRSVLDQVYIKARRLQVLDSLKREQQVDDTAADELAGIVNYCVIALDALERGADQGPPDPQAAQARGRPWSDPQEAARRYDRITARARDLVLRKDHDYGGAWRDMAVSSITDDILARTARVRHMLERPGGPAVSEGLEAQFLDMLNYAALALVRLGFPHHGAGPGAAPPAGRG